MSLWPQYREASISVKLERDTYTGYHSFGFSQSKRKDWEISIANAAKYMKKEKNVVLRHSPLHMTRLKGISITLDQDEFTFEELVNDKPFSSNGVEWLNVYEGKFRTFADKQDVKVVVKYEVYRETRVGRCHCSTCKVEAQQTAEPPLSPTTTLIDDFRQFFNSQESSDIIFSVAEEEIPAHKLVLTARLPYFKRLFASGEINFLTHNLLQVVVLLLGCDW